MLLASDLRAYGGNDGTHFLLHFQHALPSEDPWTCLHLPADSSRGRSLFVRLMRPEFIRRYREPLSPDGLRGAMSCCMPLPFPPPPSGLSHFPYGLLASLVHSLLVAGGVLLAGSSSHIGVPEAMK
jgi:hypothetical protein